MAVFNGSRYKGSYVYSDVYERDIIFLDIIQESTFHNSLDDIAIEFREGDRLDTLARHFYGDSMLEWVILQANPQYSTPLDIKVGDTIRIPLPERVMDTL